MGVWGGLPSAPFLRGTEAQRLLGSLKAGLDQAPVSLCHRCQPRGTLALQTPREAVSPGSSKAWVSRGPPWAGSRGVTSDVREGP